MADLERAGHLPPLWYQDNSLESPWWVVRQSWHYSTTFPSPDEFLVQGTPKAVAATLLFDGLDYNATITLNGIAIGGSHYGSFIPASYSVGHLLMTNGTLNRLVVTLTKAPETLITPLYNGSTPMYGVDQCLENKIFPFWKSRLNQWDFATKYWQIGIWRHVRLRIHSAVASLDPALIALPRFKASAGAPPYSTVGIELRGRLRSEFGYRRGKASALLRVTWEISCTTDPSAAPVNATTIVDLAATAVIAINATVAVANPRLWWPNGYGAQHMYRLTASLTLANSSHSLATLLDKADISFGIRKLENVANARDNTGLSWYPYHQYNIGCGPCTQNSSEYPGGENGYPAGDRWQFKVNGRPVFARGGNWVPGDLAYGRLVANPARFKGLIDMAKVGAGAPGCVCA